jgi:hypothetical protein
MGKLLHQKHVIEVFYQILIIPVNLMNIAIVLVNAMILDLKC